MNHTDLKIFQCATVAAEKLREEGQNLTLRLICNAVEHWEKIRPQDDTQLIRTNHALAEELADVKARLASAERGERAADQEVERLQRKVAGLKADIVELNQRLHERTQAFLAKEAKKTPAPLTFGEPPEGREWHNPGNLTPEQVEVDKGWRLFLKGEARHDGYQDYIFGHWTSGDQQMIKTSKQLTTDVTYRTKAPLPAPKPTPEELERREFEEWYSKASLDERCDAALHGWKAVLAKSTTPGS